jgi:hypothetical protein
MLATNIRQGSVIVIANYNVPARHATRPQGPLSFIEPQEFITTAGATAGEWLYPRVRLTQPGPLIRSWIHTA